MNKATLLSMILAFIASTITLWLLESSLKLMLYFFEAALILTIYHSLHGNFKKTSFETKEKHVTKYHVQYGLRRSFREKKNE
jgi:hypothetical protein